MRPESGVPTWVPGVLGQPCVSATSRPEQPDHVLCRKEGHAQRARGPWGAEPCFSRRLGPPEKGVRRVPRALTIFPGRAKKTIPTGREEGRAGKGTEAALGSGPVPLRCVSFPELSFPTSPGRHAAPAPHLLLTEHPSFLPGRRRAPGCALPRVARSTPGAQSVQRPSGQ